MIPCCLQQDYSTSVVVRQDAFSEVVLTFWSTLNNCGGFCQKLKKINIIIHIFPSFKISCSHYFLLNCWYRVVLLYFVIIVKKHLSENSSASKKNGDSNNNLLNLYATQFFTNLQFIQPVALMARKLWVILT